MEKETAGTTPQMAGECRRCANATVRTQDVTYQLTYSLTNSRMQSFAHSLMNAPTHLVTHYLNFRHMLVGSSLACMGSRTRHIVQQARGGAERIRQ